MDIRKLAIRVAAVVAGLAAMTFLYHRLFQVNPTTVALTFLVIVLLVAAYWELQIALFSAVLATALFNFYFLPPYGTFTIADPQNWIALFMFLVTAVIASNLADRARRQAELALRRREEVERLYALSRQLLTSDNSVELSNFLPGHIAETFGATGAAVVFAGNQTIYRTHPDLVFDTELLLHTAARGEVSQTATASYAPLRIGVTVAGALAIIGVDLSRPTLEAIGSLAGLAAERARAIEELAHNRASQEHEKLRAALLDSVTHEFRTPLTSIKASVTGLLEENTLDPAERRDLLSVIDEEADRLNRLVGEAAEMAQLDAKMFRLHKFPHRIAEVIEAALASARIAPEMHPTPVEYPADLPHASFDFERIREVLTHLLENAAKYSPAGSPIHISAEHRANDIIISIADHGSGIDPIEQTLIFEKFYRGRGQRLQAQGTGMGLAISKVIVEAHGGFITLVSQPGNGSVFSVHLPIA